ncbi:transport and Golgi organization protein 1 homolog isoform X2 [Astyanax mexicanus]|uniref:transport and Golgi organization protein 1 homolog isoform X2 n=1 Tax=Astyanax mexicanus TaxID=7994 RepID=UPI0020CB4D55|nr:transport and Golgi organization protein 1 homolog isoform X2 [Astyanax mexicanus]
MSAALSSFSYYKCNGPGRVASHFREKTPLRTAMKLQSDRPPALSLSLSLSFNFSLSGFRGNRTHLDEAPQGAGLIMRFSRVLISLQILLGLISGTEGLMSDYKTCGDPACERMMSRVQALKDHQARDCRFLSFRKGDMIEVYHKLWGKRSDLWAGSIDQQIGYFPRDAVKIDEVFVDEKNEIKTETQQYDFYCIDEFGSLFESDSSEIDDLDDQGNQDDQEEQGDQHDQDYRDAREDQRANSEQLGNSDFDDPVSKSSQTDSNIKREEDTQANPKQDQEKSENSGSSWIGSAVTGWFGGGEVSQEESKEESKEESHDEPQGEDVKEKDVQVEGSFKSRKLALDIDGNQLGDEKQAETLGWIGGELTNVFGFGKKASEDDTKDSPEEIIENKEILDPDSNTKESSSWLGMGIRDVLGFGGGDDLKKPEAEDKDEGIFSTILKDEPSQPLDSIEDTEQGDKNVPNKAEQQETSRSYEDNVDHPPADADTKTEDSGWYGSVYSRITNLYGDAQDNTSNNDDSVSKDGGSDSVLEPDDSKLTQNTLETEGQDTETGQQSQIFSDKQLSTAFDDLKSQFPSDTAETEVQKTQEDKPPEQTDPGKEAFVEKKIDYDEENNKNNGGDEINPSSTGDLISEKLEKPISPSVDVRDDVQIIKETEMPEPNEVDDVMQAEVRVETSSKDQTKQSQTDGENEKDTDIYGGKVLTDGSIDNMAGVDDSGTLKQPESPTEKRLLHKEPLETVETGEVLVGEVLNTEASVDNAQTDLTIDQSDNTQSVLNSGKAAMLSDEPALNELVETKNLTENILNIPSDSVTVMDTNEDDVAQLKEQKEDNNADLISDNNQKTNIFSGYFDYFSAQKDTKPESNSDSTSESAVDANKHEQIQQVDPKTKQSDSKSYKETQSEEDSAFNTTDEESVDDLLKSEKGPESILTSQRSKTEHALQSSATDKSSDIAESSEKAKRGESKEEWKREIVPDVSKQEYSTSEKVADATVIQSKEIQDKIPLKQSTDTENPSDANTANEELSSDSTEDFTTDKESNITTENESQKEFEQEKITENASEGAKTLTEERTEHASKTEDVNTNHIASKISLDSTKDFTTDKTSDILLENESNEATEQLTEEHTDHVSITEDANTDHVASKISLHTTEDFTTDKKSDILSENVSTEVTEQDKMTENASEEAKTLDVKYGDPVSIAKDANTDHTDSGISLDRTKDLNTDKEGNITSENESQREFEQEKTTENASEEAKTLDVKYGDPVSIAKDANTDHTDSGISLDSTKDFTTDKENYISSENESQKEFEQEITILNVSEKAKALLKEHTDHVSITEDANTNQIASKISLDSTKCIATEKKSDILSENESHEETEQEKTTDNASEDAKTLDVKHGDPLSIAEDANTDHNAAEIKLDDTKDFTTDTESDNLSDNKHHKGSKREETVKNASEDANALDEEHSSHVSIAEEHTALDVSLDSTKDFAKDGESTVLSEIKHKNGFEKGENFLNIMPDGAKDANTDHTVSEIGLGSSKNIPTAEEHGFISETNHEKDFKQEEPIKNVNNKAEMLDKELGDHVNLDKNVVATHTASDISLGSTEDLNTEKKSDILSENEIKKGFDQEEPVQNASEDANTLDGKHFNPVSIAQDANKDHIVSNISKDSTLNFTTDKESESLSENERQKGFKQEEPVKNASEDANTLDGEYFDPVSIDQDSTDHIVSNISTVDFTSDKESERLSENESQKGFEQEEPIPNITEDANALVREDGIELTVETRTSNTINEDKNYKSLISDDLKANNGDNLNVVDQERHEDLHTSTKSEEKLEQIYDTHIKPTSDSQLSISIRKHYPNLRAQLSEENIKDLLGVFGGHKLSWLDKTLGRAENLHLEGQRENIEDLSKLDDFEVEYYLKIRANHGEDDETFAKVDALLSSLRKTLMPVVTEGSVDKVPDLSQNQPGDKGSFIPKNQEAPISDPEPEKDDKTEFSLSTDDTDSLNSVPEEQIKSGDVAEQSPIVENFPTLDGDSTKSDKTGFNSQEHSGTEEFVEPKQMLSEDLYRYAAFVGEGTSYTFTYVIQKSAHLRDVMYEDLTMAEEFKGESAAPEASDIAGTARIYYSLALEKIRDVVQSLPDDIRPGPDLYGLPWEVVLVTSVLGLFTVLLFSCRFIQSIKSRLYASKERRMGQKVAELLEEKCKVLETLSECQHKFKKLETALQNGGVAAQASEKENLEVMSKKLDQSNAEMRSDIERLQEELEIQSKFRKQQEEQLAELENTLKNLEEDAKERKVQLEQDKTTLKIHEMNTERLQKKLVEAREENTMLLESKAQLVQEAEGWGERLSELEEEKRMCERSHAGMVEDCTNKDERIKSLTDCLLKMKDWDSEEEEGGVDGSSAATGSENGDASDVQQKQKLQKLIHAAKMSADLKAIEEDKGRVFAKLSDELKAKEDLQEGIQQLQQEKESLESDSSTFTTEIQKLQQKLQIMTEMYQENELKLHRMLTVEEKERLQKEEKLNKAGKKINMAAEELNTYRLRANDLEEELDRTSQAYRNQIASHEKKAHDNWLAARAADRDLSDVKRENSVLRQRLTDYQFKLELMEKEPYAREAPGRPVFRGERSPYGPSPLGRPASETRAFLSPPTLMDGPPRISPQFPMMPGGRVSRGVVEPPAGGLEGDRSGPHSDSGSASPSWEKERRGPGPLPGPPPPDPGMLYRRPPPGPFPMGPPPPRPPPPDAYYGEKPDFLGNSSGPGENDSRDSLRSMHGDMRVPPDADMRMGPPPGPPMGLPPPMDPRDPHFPRRMPYGPPDYFPPRGPGFPPMGMRGPPPPGMFPRPPLPHPMAYPPMRPPPDGFIPGPPLRPPPPDSFQPGPPPRPSPPGSEQPPEQPPSPHHVI